MMLLIGCMTMDPREMDPYAVLGMPASMLAASSFTPATAAATSQQQTSVVMQRTVGGEEEEEEGKIAQEDVHQTDTTEVFSAYSHNEIIPGCQPHPGDIVEAAPLAALSLPPATYPLSASIPRDTVATSKLSSLQLEGILYACQRHQLILPNDTRAGFFIGDGAGVGKGRQIAGIILDNFARGRTRHVWFSISTDLIVDARRDLSDIGCHVKVIEGCQQLDRETRVFGLPKDFKEGIIFSTYATLVSSVNKGGTFSSGRSSRLQQLLDWCGGRDFDGCLVFDECHKAKNFVPGKEAASTKVAVAVTQIQRQLPHARVVYCSATGVTDVKNMAFMERMGLWGTGAAFASFDHFLETVQKKGLGVAEMLAMEMKTSGMYVSRGLSFRDAQFLTEEADLTPPQVKMYNVAAHVWNELRKSLIHALGRTSSTNSRVWSSFWGAHQRFFKQLCMGMKVPTVVRLTKAALEDGFCVVIGLQTTGEASLEAELSRSGDSAAAPLRGFVSLCREIFTRFVNQHFPTTIENAATPGEQDEWAVTAKKMLLDFAAKIQLPDSPLDALVDGLGGPGAVAEMTGRRGRVVRRSPGATPQYEARAGATDSTGADSVDSLNVRERNMFMEGKKMVAIISDAASTGISLHADQRAGNQRRRVHVTLELPWSADRAVQQLGRSHRSNQTSGPIYKLLTTNLGGERRFAAAVAKRLQSLGALTKGDRRAASGADLGEFNFDSVYGRLGLRAMYSAVCGRFLVPGVALSQVTDKDFSEFNDNMLTSLGDMGILEEASLTSAHKVKDSIAGDVSRFLNRLLGLRVDRQNQLFRYFTLCMEAQVSTARREGRYSEGVADVHASSVRLAAEPREVFKAKNTSNNPTKHMVLLVDRGLSWERALERHHNLPGSHNGFYVSRRRDTKRGPLYLLATRREEGSRMFTIARPNTGISTFEEEQTELLNKYSPVPPEKAEAGWKEIYASSELQCMHGPACKHRGECSVGSRVYKLHLLTGGIVTMMNILQLTLTKYQAKFNLTKAEVSLRVVRAQLDSGQRVLGVRYPVLLIPLAERQIQEEALVARALQASKAQQTILSAGMSLQLPPSADASSQARAAAVVDSVLEPPAPVIQKFLTKALTPPITIKNFFKPKPKTKDQNMTSVMDKTTDKINSNDKLTEGASKRKSDVSKSVNGVGTKAKKSICEKVDLTEESDSCSEESDALKDELNGVESSTTSPNKCSKVGDLNGNESIDLSQGNVDDVDDDKNEAQSTLNNAVSDQTNQENAQSENSKAMLPNKSCKADTSKLTSITASQRGIKRRRQDDADDEDVFVPAPAAVRSRTVAPARPAAKQASLAGMFNRQKQKIQEKKNAARSCPICGRQFLATALNAEINAHVDNCLIT